VITWLQSPTNGRFWQSKKSYSDTKNRKGNEVDVCRVFCLVNSAIQTTSKNGAENISVIAENGSRIKRFRKPERSGFHEALYQ
jgi:hypothetical protein